MPVSPKEMIKNWHFLRRRKSLVGFFCGIPLLAWVLFSSTLITDISQDNKPSTATKYSLDDTPQTDFSTTTRLMDRKNSAPKENTTKLFLFAYMRGGSSIAGELFNCDPSATMWYEPGDAFYSSYYGLFHGNLPQNDLYFTNMTRRKLKSDELEALVNFYSNTFSCNYEDLPPESMAHHFLTESTAMDGYVKCMKGKRTKNIDINECKQIIHNICRSNMVETSLDAKCHVAIEAVKVIMKSYPNVSSDKDLLRFLQNTSLAQRSGSFVTDLDKLKLIRHGRCIETIRRDNAKCIEIAIRKCKQDRLRVVQVNRMKMEDLEPIIEANPDMYVVHYTRDPRAIAYSRYRTHALKVKTNNVEVVKRAKYICHKMREDTRQRMILEKKYPDVFTHLTYEHLAVDPESFARRIYGIFNMTYPKQWRRFVAEHMHARRNGGAFGITVQNATKTAFRWRYEVPEDQLKKINSFCADVISSLGYEL